MNENNMIRPNTLLKLKLCALAFWLTSAAFGAQAVGRLAEITVIDRSTGVTLPVYSHRGEYWVAGAPGARYAISVRSKLSQRLLAVPAVDGINVLSGQTAAWLQAGYVFSSHSQHQITGWRKSDSEVAAFEFAALQNSYAAQTGRPANVGVIGVALFREKQPPQPQIFKELSSQDMGDATASATASAKSRPAPAAESSSNKSEQSGLADLEGSAGQRSAPQPTARLGTAHGQRETSVVSSTTFERRGSQPDEVILIRYDSHANLIAQGVIRAPQQHPLPHAFPDSPIAHAPSYVPDPPQRRY